MAFLGTMINSGKTFNAYGDKESCGTFKYNFMQLVVNFKGDRYFYRTLPSSNVQHD